jgi:hypothetical protein
MPQRANVTSVEALESFRASLIIYISKARPTLEEASSDILRTRVWLENDQRLHWQNQVRHRTKELLEAQQSLFSARVSGLPDAVTTAQSSVTKTKRALEEAETKLSCVKKWSRDFDSRIQPLAKQLEKLHTILANDMPHAVAYLTKTKTILDDYIGSAPPATSPEEALSSQSNETISSSEKQDIIPSNPPLPQGASQPDLSIGDVGKHVAGEESNS